MRRALLAVAFAAALAATFPTDALVRALTARALPPTWPPVTVGEARLRPSALRLRNVSLRRRDGTALLTLDSLDLHPSLIGLLAGRRGLPLRLVATGCGGSAEGAVTGSPTAAVVTLAVTGVKLADCLPVAMAGSALAGRADARATLQLSAAAPAGDGAVDLRDARWHGTVRTLPGIDALRAEHASLRWSLREERVIVSDVELRGPDIEASGSGEVRLVQPIAASRLALDLAIVAGTAAPPLIRLLLAGGAPRPVRIGGTLRTPVLMLP